MSKQLSSVFKELCIKGELIVSKDDLETATVISAMLAEGIIAKEELRVKGCESCPLSKVCGIVECVMYVYRLTDKGRRLCNELFGGAAGI